MEKEKTLRDEFSMAALQGYLHSYPGVIEATDNQRECAEMCYEMADAMLIARKDGH